MPQSCVSKLLFEVNQWELFIIVQINWSQLTSEQTICLRSISGPCSYIDFTTSHDIVTNIGYKVGCGYTLFIDVEPQLSRLETICLDPNFNLTSHSCSIPNVVKIWCFYAEGLEKGTSSEDFLKSIYSISICYIFNWSIISPKLKQIAHGFEECACLVDFPSKHQSILLQWN